MKTFPTTWREPGDPRRSTRVAVVLLAAAGAVGLPLYMMNRHQVSQNSDGWVTGTDDQPPVTVDQEYSNDHYVNGAGYYHAPYFAWFPYRYNYYDSGRGYYAGGIWRTAPEINPIVRSRPTVEAVTAASVLARERAAQAARGSGFSSHSSGFRGYTGGSSSSSSKGSSSTGITHGGFGQSAGHAGSGSS